MNTPLNALDALILAGGMGTRLQSVVSDRPKPVADVGGKPFLEHLLCDLRRQGIRRVTLCTGHQSEAIRDYFGDGSQWQLQLDYSHEQAPLGTGGALRQALDRVRSERFFALNGDSFCNPDLALLHRRHVERNASASLWLVSVNDCQRFGRVDLAADSRISAFREKSAAHGTGLISAGVYLIERTCLETLPLGKQVSLETEVFPALIGKGICGVTGNGPFIDIGTPESYAQAETFFASLGK